MYKKLDLYIHSILTNQPTKLIQNSEEMKIQTAFSYKELDERIIKILNTRKIL
ncbi:hypothetical protein V7112_11625 [Bacillus sp. JJ1566]|uniref:hypothetical protein n=1 Tax=Bacillus sp. JJ1566 TaxID=3122961 RepID=UPI002FFEBA48